jgi:hypothetical protein
MQACPPDFARTPPRPMNRRTLLQSCLAGMASALLPRCLHAAGRDGDLDPRSQPAHRTGRVGLEGHALVDGQGAFLGLGVSYFTALWRYRHDRARIESDLAFLAQEGFQYTRVLSMVGWFPAWQGLEIAPVSFTNRAGAAVAAWSDYRDSAADIATRVPSRRSTATAPPTSPPGTSAGIVRPTTAGGR